MNRRLQLLLLCCGLFLFGCERFNSVACRLTIKEANERVLKQDLFALRSSISQYTLDKKQPPPSLNDLVHAGYLRMIPTDPITRKVDWVPVQDDSLMSVDQTEPGINDVHSASLETACDGTIYSNW
jgi:general secretion pathway protein G